MDVKAEKLELLQLLLNTESEELLKKIRALFSKQVSKPETKSQKLSDKYRGVFSKEDAKNFDHHSETMRREWGNT